jgi:hypothetical protein
VARVTVEVLEAVLVVVVVDVEVPDGVKVVSIEGGVFVTDGTTTMVVVLCGVDVDVAVTVGATYTVAVELRTHPTPKHVYPGIQQPPPGLLGQLV